jgi:arginase
VIGSIAVIGAPSAIGIRPYDGGGARRLDLTPGVLRQQDLAARLGAADLGDVMPPQRYRDLVRPAGRGRNEEDVASYSRQLAERVAAAAAEGLFVLLLGGDCSIMLGALLGLRQAGRWPVGLVYIDAHSDFATLEESPSGSACSMNLALATGRSDTPLAHLDEGGPLVDAADVVHLGSRDETQPYGFEALTPAGVLAISQRTIEASGIDETVAATLARVAKIEAGFWIHFDVDVLNPELMPAVDSPIPGGLDIQQAAALLAPLVRHPAALGLQVTIYDPTIDPNGSGAVRIVELLEQTLRDRSGQ